MDGLRIKKIESACRDVLASCVSIKMRDPALQGVVITYVHVTPDLKLARIYFSHGLGRANEADILKHLRRSRGFFKKELSEQLRLRFMPDLQFFYDDTDDETRRVESLFKKLDEEKKSKT